jgi:hypothetical protein
MTRRILFSVLFLAVLGACSASGPSNLSAGPEITRLPVAEVTTVAPITVPPTTTTPTTVAPVTSTRPPATTPVTTPRTTLDTTPDTTDAPRAAAVDTSGGCHPSYAGTCLPADASDVDCGGGSGNGPVYATAKRFQVVGPDVFDLDRDGDGIACES